MTSTEFFPAPAGHHHVQPVNIAAWLYHRGFETLAQRTLAIKRMFDGELRFVWGAIEYRVTHENVGEFDWYDVRTVNFIV